MQRFFPDFDALNPFTVNLDIHVDKLECRHCLRRDQFVSHGIIYKQRSIHRREKVGKRLFCSNRYGRRGCGRTVQLYVATEFPYFRYQAAHLFVFILSLLARLSVKQAYRKATRQSDTRHAWRWLNRLAYQLSEFRTFLGGHAKTLLCRYPSRVRRLQILLSTLEQLYFHFSSTLCADYQVVQQKPFI